MQKVKAECLGEIIVFTICRKCCIGLSFGEPEKKNKKQTKLKIVLLDLQCTFVGYDFFIERGEVSTLVIGLCVILIQNYV